MQQVQAGKRVFGKCQPVVVAGTLAQWLSGLLAKQPTYFWREWPVRCLGESAGAAAAIESVTVRNELLTKAQLDIVISCWQQRWKVPNELELELELELGPGLELGQLQHGSLRIGSHRLPYVLDWL